LRVKTTRSVSTPSSADFRQGKKKTRNLTESIISRPDPDDSTTIAESRLMVKPNQVASSRPIPAAFWSWAASSRRKCGAPYKNADPSRSFLQETTLPQHCPKLREKVSNAFGSSQLEDRPRSVGCLSDLSKAQSRDTREITRASGSQFQDLVSNPATPGART